VKWGPKFYPEHDGTTEPQNLMGSFFWAVAQCFDPDYTTANCSAVVSRVKDLSRSPESIEKRKRRKREYIKNYKRKKRLK
jgi:hypothetical protein